MKMTLNEEIEYLQSGNWYDKVQAVLPADEYLKLGWAIGDILETLGLFRSLAPEPQTNADRIRAMSDEELAKFLEYEGGEGVNKLDVAGLLKTYAEQVAMNGNSTEKLRDIVRDLKEQLDLRKLRQPAEED